jgi:hypothetical protein
LENRLFFETMSIIKNLSTANVHPTLLEKADNILLELEKALAEGEDDFDAGYREGVFETKADIIDLLSKQEAFVNKSFCKWHQNKSGQFYSECTPSHMLRLDANVLGKYKYCPYCGKKIKLERVNKK